MRNRSLGFSLVAILAALGADAAGAAEVSGWLGGAGNRFDAWSPSHESTLQLHLDAGLSASGYLFSPDDIDWRGNVQYGRNRATYTGAQNSESLLTFNATAAAFDSRQSNFALRLGASRAQSDSTQSSSATELTGTTLTNSLSAEARAGGGGYPGISVGGSWIDTTNSGMGRPDLHRATKELDATAGHGGEGYTYQLSYRGRIEEGSLAPLDYIAQTLSFNGRAQLTSDTELGVFGQHYTRTPRTFDATNPTYDDTTLSAITTTTLPGLRMTARYNFGHFLLESSAIPATERFHDDLSLAGERVLSPEWSVIPAIGVAYSQDRLGTAETSAAGQSLGSNLRWNHSLPAASVLAEAGLRVGLIEPAGGGLDLGWGATAAGRYAGSSGPMQYGASYRLDFDDQMNAIRGWTLAQNLSGDLTRQLDRSLSVVSGLTIGAYRGNSSLAGNTASRNANLFATLQWPTRSLGLMAGWSDGVAGALADPIRGDAMFLPTSFQTHSRSVAVIASATFEQRWTAQATIRYASISGPGVPDQQEMVYFARVSYLIGQFVLAAEDAYRTMSAADIRINQFMITFTRHFRL